MALIVLIRQLCYYIISIFLWRGDQAEDLSLLDTTMQMELKPHGVSNSQVSTVVWVVTESLQEVSKIYWVCVGSSNAKLLSQQNTYLAVYSG